MKLNLHEESRVVFGFCRAIGATGAVTAAIDTKGYNGVEFHLLYGLTAAVTDTLTVLITESDASTGGFTSVADTNLNGTEALASRLGVTTHVSGTSINVSKSVGYKGLKRYVKAKVTPVGTATMIVGCVATLFSPEAVRTNS
jgi:hypothetical protein